MPIRVHNSLTKTKEDFIPATPSTVTMYACGVTVYDRCHLGHARSLYVFDVIRRFFQYRGFKVRFIRNITDIDDKIIEKTKELKKRFEEVVKEYITAYEGDLKRLAIDKAASMRETERAVSVHDLEPRHDAQVFSEHASVPRSAALAGPANWDEPVRFFGRLRPKRHP